MLKLLEKQIDGKYYYKGQKAEYIAECDEIGNSFLTINNHSEIKNGTTALCNPWLEGCEQMIERIESGRKMLF